MHWQQNREPVDAGVQEALRQSGHGLTIILDENRRGQCEWEWFTYNGCGFTVLRIKSTYAILLQLHAKESSEIYCHTCLLLFKEKKARISTKADQAFVSILSIASKLATRIKLLVARLLHN